MLKNIILVQASCDSFNDYLFYHFTLWKNKDTFKKAVFMR